VAVAKLDDIWEVQPAPPENSLVVVSSITKLFAGSCNL